MTYKETLEYLYHQLPMFHRIGPAAYKANLDNSIAISNYLGNPEKYIRAIHIAGTNGKGSVSNILASILQQHGLKTGLATSPHLRDFRERIRINGEMIPRKEIQQFVKQHKEFFDSIKPSFFEISIGLTFDYFKKQGVDVAVIETGLGGRLDSTNIITPILSIITNIGMDHMNLLGDTLEKIAGEKAGIIKSGVPVVIGRNQPGISHVFSAKADDLKADLYEAWEMYQPLKVSLAEVSGRKLQELSYQKPCGKEISVLTDLMGFYQLENMSAVLTAIQVLKDRNLMPISHAAVQEGLAHVRRNTGFMGRWQQLAKRPLIYCDTAHNADGILEVVRQIESQHYNTLRIVFGMVDDKDSNAILQLMPYRAVYYFCKPDIPRGLDPNLLAEKAGNFGLKGKVFDSVQAAFKQAKLDALRSDLIFVGGSTFVVAEVVM